MLCSNKPCCCNPAILGRLLWQEGVICVWNISAPSRLLDYESLALKSCSAMLLCSSIHGHYPFDELRPWRKP